MSNINLNILHGQAYKIVCNHEFHDKELSNEHFLCLVISELMEAVEAGRKGRKSNKERYEYNEITECQGWFITEEKFISVFNRCIKDTVEDELADVVIRLFDLVGTWSISLEFAIKDIADCIDDTVESCKDETFTESLYAISTLVSRYEGLYDFATAINDMVMFIFGLAKRLDIDLLWHIEQKVKYNQFREKMHGEKY